MTGSELRTIRESLRVTTEWMARRANVDLRAYEHWEVNNSLVPESLARLVNHYVDTVEDLVNGSMRAYRQMFEMNGYPERVILTEFQSDQELWTFYPIFKTVPTAIYSTALKHLAFEMESIGVKTKFDCHDQDESCIPQPKTDFPD